MSTLINFSIFPLDKGESVSVYVARALKIVRDSGLAYRLNPMGTAIEGEWDEVMDVVTSCFEEIKKDCDRVYMTVNADYRKDKLERIESKGYIPSNQSCKRNKVGRALICCFTR